MALSNMVSHAQTGVILGLVAFLVFMMFASRRNSSGYLSPVSINAKYTNTQDFSSLPNNLSCVVGPGESSGYYSRGLTPGGLCGDQKLIREQMRGYQILSGVGGGLLEK